MLANKITPSNSSRRKRKRRIIKRDKGAEIGDFLCMTIFAKSRRPSAVFGLQDAVTAIVHLQIFSFLQLEDLDGDFRKFSDNYFRVRIVKTSYGLL